MEYFIFLKPSKIYTTKKFYETTPVITNQKGHQKLTLLGHSKKKKKTDITISIYPTKYPVIMVFGTPQTEIACSELTKETLEQGVKCIQS